MTNTTLYTLDLHYDDKIGKMKEERKRKNEIEQNKNREKERNE